MAIFFNPIQILEVRVRLNKFVAFVPDNVRLVLLGGRTEDTAQLIAGERGEIVTQLAAYETFAVLASYLDISFTETALNTPALVTFLPPAEQAADDEVLEPARHQRNG